MLISWQSKEKRDKRESKSGRRGEGVRQKRNELKSEFQKRGDTEYQVLVLVTGNGHQVSPLFAPPAFEI